METNVLPLKPSDATKALTACVEARENVALIGPPGCGKSSLVAQVAAETQRDLIVSLPALEDPTEPGGFPWIAADHTHAKKVLFAQAFKAVTAKKPAIWHLEDFGQGENAVQKAYMQWAQAREIDGNRLPDYVSITMATNRRTDKAGVGGILEPVKGRFTLLHLRSDLDDFCNNLFKRGKSEYGLSDDAIVNGVAFLRMREELLNKFEPTADMTNSPTERNWVSAFHHTMHGAPKHIEHALIAGRVGLGAASEFTAFLDQIREMPSIEGILLDPTRAIIPEKPSQLFAVAVGLAARVTEENIGAIICYAERLESLRNDKFPGGLGEFAVLLVRDCARRNPRAASTRAWVEMASGRVGKLMTGRGD